MTTEMRLVPDRGVYQAPACENCGEPFAQVDEAIRGQQVDGKEWVVPPTWQQICPCQNARRGGMHVMQFTGKGDGSYTKRFQEYFDPALIGQPIPTQCVLCGAVLPPGTEAAYGPQGRHHYYGYAHPACALADTAAAAAAEQEAIRAGAGVHLAIWFSLDDTSVVAPATGHYDSATRFLPSMLPPLPEGTVVYQDYNRPFAMCRIDIPDRLVAEAWWQAATAVADARYELHWYEVPQQPATRSWAGAGFDVVVGRARDAEIRAGTL